MHRERLHYGLGLCRNCYHLSYYHRKRALTLQRIELEQERAATAAPDTTGQNEQQ